MAQTDYTRHTHHEFLDAAEQAMHDANLQLALANLGDTLGRRNRETWADFPQSDALREQARTHQGPNARPPRQAPGDARGQRQAARRPRPLRRRRRRRPPDHRRHRCKSRGATKVVKTKSMTTEEIHLNQALEPAGFEVVETDFGEFIIQLAGERPSHLVAPAVHLHGETSPSVLSAARRRAAARRRPKSLAATARRRLREKFRHGRPRHHRRRTSPSPRRARSCWSPTRATAG